MMNYLFGANVDIEHHAHQALTAFPPFGSPFRANFLYGIANDALQCVRAGNRRQRM
jgi:hypothetical protein